MEGFDFSEDPIVEGQYSRNVIFPALKWISKSKFISLIEKCPKLNIQPCLNSNENIHKRLFLGKSIPKYTQDQNNTEVDIDNVEIVGNVYFSVEKKWKLKTTFKGRSYEISDEFLILNIKDVNSIFWKSINMMNNFEQKIPKYALKVSFDSSEHHYMYAGRLKEDNSNTDCSIIYYSNAMLRINEKFDSFFGKISPTTKLLFSQYQDLEIGHFSYEILCLKPSPASLKALCKSSIRKYLNYSQKKIKSLSQKNEEKIHLPQYLVNYLKFPSFLKIGDFMFKEDKIVHENDKYEMLYDAKKNNLICRYLDRNCDDQECIFLANVDSIMLHPFNAVFYNSSNSKATKSQILAPKINPYKFYINWENSSFEIKYL
ncbi:unnamed protein product [Brachionus calyciflorus]|uniref:Uncharacterized protein n=1 Tax=Brachionus calyciflorus TaxID=104777 RepID=A0A813REZ9_9BILA|nr:unnamed protein product [Brachionus calyciflorus]